MEKGKGGNLLVKKFFVLECQEKLGFWINLHKQIWDFLKDFTYSKLSILSPKFLIYNIWFGRLIKGAQTTITHNHKSPNLTSNESTKSTVFLEGKIVKNSCH